MNHKLLVKINENQLVIMKLPVFESDKCKRQRFFYLISYFKQFLFLLYFLFVLK